MMEEWRQLAADLERVTNVLFVIAFLFWGSIGIGIVLLMLPSLLRG